MEAFKLEKSQYVSALYILLIGISLFAGFISFELSARFYTYATSEILFFYAVYWCTKPTSQTIVDHILSSKLSLGLWLTGLAMILLPYVIHADHFSGSYLRLGMTLHILAIYPILILYFKREGAAATRSLLTSSVVLLAIYCITFFTTHTTGLYAAPAENSLDFTFPGFSNIRQPPFLIAPIAVVALVLAAERAQLRRDGWWWCILFASAMLWCLILWSGSRGGLVAALAGLLASILVARTYAAKLLESAILVIPTAIGLAYLLPPGRLNMNVRRIFESASNISEPATISKGRVDVWTFAIENIKDHPFLGHGLGAFPGRDALHFPPSIVHAHNGYLDIMHAGGLIAAICVVSWILGVYFRLMFHARSSKDTVLVASFAALSVVLAFAMIDGVFFNYRPLMLTVILFAVAQYHINLAKKA